MLMMILVEDLDPIVFTISKYFPSLDLTVVDWVL